MASTSSSRSPGTGSSVTRATRQGPTRPRPTDTDPSRARTSSAEAYVAALAKPAVSLVP
jgi:hypothetical protein